MIETKYKRPRGDEKAIVVAENIAGAAIPIRVRGALCQDGIRRSATILAPRTANADGAQARVTAYMSKTVLGTLQQAGDEWLFIAKEGGKNSLLIAAPRRIWTQADAGPWEEIGGTGRGSIGAGVDIIALAEASGWRIETVMRNEGMTDDDRQMSGAKYVGLWQRAENFLNRVCCTVDVAFGISKDKRYGLWRIEDLQ